MNILKKLTLLMLVCSLFNFTFSSSVYAQDKETKKAEKIKKKIAKKGVGNKPILVKLKDKTKFKGQISEIDDDFFVMTNKKDNTSQTIYYNQVNKIQRVFSKTENAIAIAGAGFGVTMFIYCFVAKQCID